MAEAIAMHDRNALIEANLHLVKWQASKYWHIAKDRGVDWDTLLQEGSIGLIKAAQIYDPMRGAFSSIAVPYVRGGIQKCLGLRKEKVNLEKLSKGAMSILHKRGIAALDAPIGEDEKGTLYDLLGSYSDDLTSVYVNDYLSLLHKSDRRILELHIEGYTQDEISRKVGISQTQTSRRLRALSVGRV